MPCFIVSKENKETVEFTCDPSDSILQFKQIVKENYKLQENEYVDLEFILDKPIRSLGKFNLEPGVIPRTMDRYKFNQFDLEERTIQTTFHVIQNYKQPIRKKQIKKPSGAYKPPAGEIKSGDSYETPKFDINSKDDFPSL
jgi:hypothetical protein